MNLNQVTVPSTDLSKSIIFYERLGLELIVDATPNYIRFECPEGDSTFSVHLVDELATAAAPIVYFETRTLDQEVKRLQNEGIEFDLLPVDQSWGWREARLKDPDGNQIVLFFGGDYRKNPPWRVK